MSLTSSLTKDGQRLDSGFGKDKKVYGRGRPYYPKPTTYDPRPTLYILLHQLSMMIPLEKPVNFMLENVRT